MDKNLLQNSINKFQSELFASIRTATYNGETYPHGQKAKEALIRSQTLIFNVHESVKKSFHTKLKSETNFNWSVHPPLNQNTPELKIYGTLKGKDQDIVFLRTPVRSSRFNDGPNIGQVDAVGIEATKKSIIIGVRSQMSSVDKNFDTLMERAFAETLNLRLRAPVITMGEVYVLPIEELDAKSMLINQVKFSGKQVKVEKFIRIFNTLSGRSDIKFKDHYKYDASALVLLDLRQSPPKIIFNKKDLKQYGFNDEICSMFEHISAEGFDERLLKNYLAIQTEAGL
jgi:hypothetical protein